MLLAFLASPVIWQKRLLAGNIFIAEYNPFTHYLAILREPMLGHVPEMTTVWIVLGMTIVGWCVALTTFIFTKNRIVFWL